MNPVRVFLIFLDVDGQCAEVRQRRGLVGALIGGVGVLRTSRLEAERPAATVPRRAGAESAGDGSGVATFTQSELLGHGVEQGAD